MPPMEATLNAYRAAHAAFVFKDGNSRAVPGAGAGRALLTDELRHLRENQNDGRSQGDQDH
jgi:hypothetical protein